MKDILYYLASPEAKSKIEAYFEAVDAHKDAAFKMQKELGATSVFVNRYGCCIGFEFKGAPIPQGWKRPAKKLKFPPDAAIGPTDWDKSLPPFPSVHKTNKELGIGEISERIYVENGQTYSAITTYGYETIGDQIVITVKSFDGVPHGNPPAGCQPLKRSEYFALKGE